MIYYTSEARNSAVQRIKDLNQKIGEIPGNILSFNDASAITGYLSILIDEIEKEEKKHGK